MHIYSRGAEDIFPVSLFEDNYAWVIRSHTQAAVIDPGDADPVLAFLQQHGLSLSHIVLTHHHADHCGGAFELKKTTGCTIIGPDDVRLPVVDLYATQDAVYTILSNEVHVIAVPGHTKTHVAYYIPKLKALFTGDTLFGAGCGRIFEGSYADMFHSLQKCALYEDETNIYAGHEYTLDNLAFALSLEPNNMMIQERIKKVKLLRSNMLPSLHSTLGEEKSTNPFLRCSDMLVRKALKIPDTADDIGVFAMLRGMKDRF
jgi:hydroxyacylglutathione hydrolase